MKRKLWQWFLLRGAIFAASALIRVTASEPLTEDCVVSILNRTARVRADGTWHIDNVPANFGLVRVRATCVKNGVTMSGQSDLINIEANIDNGFSPFGLGESTPTPTVLVLSSPVSTLATAGATAQLTVTASYPNGSTKNVARAADGTSYTISNPRTAIISANGLVTAKASGIVVISASNEGAIGMISLRVQLTGDSDGDGIPDDLEIANGLNPNNSVDAEEDADGDGLTNKQELMQYGTNMRLADTDGDGISDGDEVLGKFGYVTNPLLADSDGDGIRDKLELQSGSDPTNSSSYNLAEALQSFEVTPSSFVLTVNTIIGEASRQLTVTGHLKDGTTIDLTSTTRGTTYNSSDLFVANFGSPDGRVFAGNDGTATITVANSIFSVDIPVSVRSSTPQVLGFVNIPGFANNVDVAGKYAYVAAGAAGLQVVDVSDHVHPVVVASLDTPGNANDVRVVGNLAYVADGASGLQIISVLNPLAPALVGTVDTPGNAQDVFIAGNYAYVADGSAGLQIINISAPNAPVIVNNVATLGTAKGVAVRDTLAVIANGINVLTVDVSDPLHPNVLGTLNYGGDARDVAIQDNFAYIADNNTSLTTVEVTDPRNPVFRSSTPLSTGGRLQDVVISGRFAFGADVFFVNGVPIFDIATPANPIPRAILDFRQFRDDDGQGIAVDASYVYLTAVQGSAFTENGATGNSRLYIGQYLAIEDTTGIAPTVRITSPLNNDTVIQGDTIAIQVDASDDVEVAIVSLLLNGAVIGSDSVSPYEFTATVPSAINQLIVGAQATDFAGNVGHAPNVTLNVIPDPGTTVTGRIVDFNGNPVSGATISVFGTFTGTSGPDGVFAIPGVPTIRGNITANATVTVNGILLSGNSASMAPVASGATALGDIVVIEATFERNYGASLARCDDCQVRVDLPFSFPFFGRNYSSVFFDGNGKVTFSFGTSDYTESLVELTSQPLISTFWDDLIDSGLPETGIYYNGSVPGRAVFTWLNLAEYGDGGSTTCQLILFSDGRIQMGYSGVTSLDAIVGVTPGSGFPLQKVDFSAAGSFSTSGASTIAEQFQVRFPRGSTDPQGSGAVPAGVAENPFDLDGGFILWTPNASGGFDVRVIKTAQP